MGQAITDLEDRRRQRLVVATVGALQIPAWGSSFFLMAVLGAPIVKATGWSLTWTVGALSAALLISGLASPRVGRLIERRGGRPVLATSAGMMALGLTVLALAPHIAVFYAGWILIGLGMSAGLYDAAFSTLGRLYGEAARQPIAAVTLFGGLASTLCWPLTAYMNEAVGWRGTCLIYAAFHVAVALPAYLMVLPREAPHAAAPHTLAETHDAPAARLLFTALAAAFALTTLVASTNAVHLMTFLEHHGRTTAAAVALAALVGPAQVAARGIEMAIGRYHHPIWTLVVSVVLVGAGIAMLWQDAEPVVAALLTYGAGVGITSIARGTVPLALFGPQGYAARMGRLAQPALIASAAAPTLGAVAIEAWGVEDTLASLTALSVLNIALVAVLVAAIRKH